MTDPRDTRKKIDALWFEAMHQSIASGEDFIRYHFAALVAAAEREVAVKDAERYRHAMREAMYLLDQPEPRPHAAFSELLLALNPAIDNRKKSAIDAARG